MKIESGCFFDEETANDVLSLEGRSFPPGTAYEDQEEYYRNALRNERYVNVIARKDGKVIGYLLLVPQSEAVKDLIGDDAALVEDQECVYVETMEIDPELLKGLGGGKIFVKMTERGIEEALLKGYKRFCTHARKSMGLNNAMKKFFGDRVIRTREIPVWKWVANEPYEYIEGNLE